VLTGTSEKKKTAAATLPILGGKVYLVSSPTLVDPILKNRDLSFDPHVNDFIEGTTSVGKVGMGIFKSPEFHPAWVKIIYSSMTGVELLNMNVRAVDNIASRLNDSVAEDSINVDNFYDWIRNVMLGAASDALWGPANPFRDPSNAQDYWFVILDHDSPAQGRHH
jgi:hypothetical protein